MNAKSRESRKKAYTERKLTIHLMNCKLLCDGLMIANKGLSQDYKKKSR